MNTFNDKVGRNIYQIIHKYIINLKTHQTSNLEVWWVLILRNIQIYSVF